MFNLCIHKCKAEIIINEMINEYIYIYILQDILVLKYIVINYKFYLKKFLSQIEQVMQM